MKDIFNYNLKAHNTFGIDALCRRFVQFDTAEEAVALLPELYAEGGKLLILGGGSNLLLTGDFPGTVVHSALKGFSSKPCEGGVLLRCGSGEVFDDVVALCVENGWYGAENLSLIPGEVGASAVQNIGAYGAEVKDIVHEIEAVEVATGSIVSIKGSECAYGYRDSRFKHEWKNRFFITAVTYKLSDEFHPRLGYGNVREVLEAKGITAPTASQLRQVIIDIRRDKLPDPAVEGNAGSFFVNPVVPREVFLRIQREYCQVPHYEVDNDLVKIPAGWLIEQCGWKGRTLGPAGVHHRQALVLVNKGGATGMDIVRLCDTIKADVKSRFGIDIYSEVNII
jgi:UDP-N-acetylmuramate dehydrogenase